MDKIKNWVKLLMIFFLSIIMLYFVLTTVWPSKSRLCQDLVDYLPRAECMNLDSGIEIVERSFTEGEATSSDVRGALGKYFQAEYETTYGHFEIYYLSSSLIDYLFRFRYIDHYYFTFDDNELLKSFFYDDF